MYNKEIIKDLILSNPTFNNVDIALKYIELTGEMEPNVESLRKSVSKVRKKLNLVTSNPAAKHINKKAVWVSTKDSKTTKINNDKGTLESEVVIDYEPKDDIELAKAHRVDLTKYKISNYWTKLQPNGRFTSSLFCTLRKVGDSMSIDEIKSVMKSVINKEPFKVSKDFVSTSIRKLLSNEKALIVWVSDEHIAACVENELYDNVWNESEYYKRKSKIIEVIIEQYALHGKFDKIIFCTLGDNLDGWSGYTTRGGHQLAQNMSNKKAVQTYVEVNKAIFNKIVEIGAASKYEIYNVENSNHGGNSIDAIACLALENYLEAKYGDLFSITGFEKIIGEFRYGEHKFFLCHGKDDKHMKANMPLVLNQKTELYFKEYLDTYHGAKMNTKNHVVKGDLHQFCSQQGRFFSYNNIPSLFGSSGWVMSNIGKGNAGFCFSVVGKKDNSVGFNPVWIK